MTVAMRNASRILHTEHGITISNRRGSLLAGMVKIDVMDMDGDDHETISAFIAEDGDVVAEITKQIDEIKTLLGRRH